MMLNFELKSFQNLNTKELYEILRLRIEVFVVEQDCPYQDADNRDQDSFHLMGRDANGALLAYTRIVPPGLSYPDYSSIGRVITSEKVRGKKQGYMLMEASIVECKKLYPDHKIKISAQEHLEKFYGSFGFNKVGEGYLEDGIPHIGMLLE